MNYVNISLFQNNHLKELSRKVLTVYILSLNMVYNIDIRFSNIYKYI